MIEESVREMLFLKTEEGSKAGRMVWVVAAGINDRAYPAQIHPQTVLRSHRDAPDHDFQPDSQPDRP